MATVGRIRQRFVEEGLEAALKDRPRPGQRRKLSGKQEARLIALACSSPPQGRARWTLRLLADKVVELGLTESICHETVRQVLKKRPQTVAKPPVVHPSGERGVRGPYGRGARPVRGRL
jgi:transposase